jgi:hypothetical protein
MRFPASPRPWILLIATLAWLWASSVFTPWAADRAPRMWLYDLLFYLRFVLLFWGGGELLRLALRRAPSVDVVPLAVAGCVVIVALGYQHTAAGLRWKIEASSNALATAARTDNGDNDRRRRVGHFIVDSVRVPCADARQAWLWLGRPHGGGTGTNLALVRGNGQRPATPLHDAFAFWSAGNDWWMAYQHAGRYHRAIARSEADDAGACTPGPALSRPRQGLALSADARREAVRE